MKKLLITGLVSSFAFLASGCGMVNGLVRDSITQVQVQKAGFEVVKKGISASGQVGSVFCVIPLNGTPTQDLMNELHSRANLGPNQMFINLRQDTKIVAYLGFYCVQTLTISADVIEFKS